MSVREQPAERSARRVLLVDDHPLMRMVVRNLLEEEPDLCVCGESNGGEDALQLFRTQAPDLVLLDFFLKDTDAIELIMGFKCQNRRIPVLVFSRIEDPVVAERATRAGADGFMVKHETPEQVLAGIRQTLAGGHFFSASVARSIVRRKLHPDAFLSDPRLGVLTESEQLILRLMGQGTGLDRIALELGMDICGVEAMNCEIQRKLNLSSFQAMALLAVRLFGLKSKPPGTDARLGVDRVSRAIEQ